jgi:hypothetical protein
VRIQPGTESARLPCAVEISPQTAVPNSQSQRAQNQQQSIPRSKNQLLNFDYAEVDCSDFSAREFSRIVLPAPGKYSVFPGPPKNLFPEHRYSLQPVGGESLVYP